MPRRRSLKTLWAKRKQPAPTLLVTGLSLVAGLLIGGFGVHGVQSDRNLIESGTAVTGTVLYFYEQSAGRSRETIAVTVFPAPDPSFPHWVYLDQVVRTGGIFPRQDAPEALTGQSVTVYYNPDDPSEAVVDGWERGYLSWWTAAVLFFGLGGAVATVKILFDDAKTRRARAAK